MNMPFELGIDYGCRRYSKKEKKFLILDEKPYRFKETISDISGSDIASYEVDKKEEAYEKVIQHIRNWLVSEAGVYSVASKRILGKYTEFLRWYCEKKLSEGTDEKEIFDYPKSEMLKEMFIWKSLEKSV